MDWLIDRGSVFLLEMEDPVEDLDVEDSEDTDGIEKQLIEQIQVFKNSKILFIFGSWIG